MTEKLEDMVDVIVGPMTLKQLNSNIYDVMLMYEPDKMIIDIQKDASIKRYMANIYIDESSFHEARGLYKFNKCGKD